jgi:hypothetical protein
MTILETLKRSFDTLRGVTASSIGATASPIQEPIIYEYMDPEYVGECLVDLESEFSYELTTDENDGLLLINIFHNEPPDSRAQQLPALIRANEERTRLLQHIDAAVEKIKLEYPDFKFHIHYDMIIYSRQGEFAAGGNRRHGTQIYRWLNNRGATGMEGFQGVAGERYSHGTHSYW